MRELISHEGLTQVLFTIYLQLYSLVCELFVNI